MNHSHAVDQLSDTIQEIHRGNSELRAKFLEEYKPFVAKTAGTLCKRFLDWSKDDELSIGLIAFNYALDKYNLAKGVPFLPFARLVIESKLKDYFKQEARHQHLSLYTGADPDDEDTFSPGEIEQAWSNYQNLTIEEERQQEIEALDQLLNQFGICFDDLVDVSPKHKDTRQSMFKVAHCLVAKTELMNQLMAKKLLPIKELTLLSGVNRKTLEKGRKYIIALALILHHSEEFIYLRSYISL